MLLCACYVIYLTHEEILSSHVTYKNEFLIHYSVIKHNNKFNSIDATRLKHFLTTKISKTDFSFFSIFFSSRKIFFRLSLLRYDTLPFILSFLHSFIHSFIFEVRRQSSDKSRKNYINHEI
jgi:hypothetical protein